MCVIVISTDPKVVERTLNALLRIAKTMSRLWHFILLLLFLKTDSNVLVFSHSSMSTDDGG